MKKIVFSAAIFAGVTLPTTLTTLKAGPFEYCKKLTSITIPSSVTSIGDNAFMDCTSLKTVTVKRTSNPSCGTTPFKNIGTTFATPYSSYSSNDFCDLHIATSSGTCGTNCNWKRCGCEHLYVYGTGNVTDSSNWRGDITCTILSLRVEVPAIGNAAFYCCRVLKTIEFIGTKEIGYNAFSEANAVETLILPKSLTYINRYGFYAMTALTELHIYSTNLKFDRQILWGSPNLFVFYYYGKYEPSYDGADSCKSSTHCGDSKSHPCDPFQCGSDPTDVHVPSNYQGGTSTFCSEGVIFHLDLPAASE